MAAPLTNNSNTEQQHHQQTTNHPQQQQGLSSSSGPTTDNSVSFQVPTLLVPQIKPGGAAAQPWPPQRQAVQQQQRPQVPQQQEPQFVVFEFFGQQEQNNLNVQHQQQKLFNKWTPFSPLMSTNSRNEQMFNTSSRLPVAESVVPASSSGVRFATVQLGPDHPSMNSSDYIVSRQRSPHRSSSSRLLFDNPMFRRLPNWHFFGDDRRLVPIPPLIPLLPAMPIERTLLYIAPNESSSRQLLLLAMLDMKRRSEIMGMPAIADNSEADPATPVLQMTEDDHDLPTSSSSLLFLEPSAASVAAELLPEEELLLPVVSACPSSTSGVESMSSAEESATTGRSSRSTTPTEGGRSTPDKHHHIAADEDYVDPEHDDDEEDVVPTELLTGQHRPDALLASSATDSCASSTPNSPPTFDRRIVRMSRGTRDAVRRLSRRFEEEEEEEEEAEEEGEANVSAVETMAENKFALPPSISPPPSPSVPLAPPTILMMSTAGHTPIHRSRHCSAGSNSAPANNKRSSMNSDEAISRMDVLSERIRDFHYNEDQTHAQLNRKLQLRDQLYYAISPIFPMCGLYIVGSSLNGFGTKRSDLDLCLMITNRDIDQRTDAVVILSSVMRTLESNKIVSEQNLILAKVPILRIKFIGTFHDITVDLNVNNSVAIRNTHLMCYYSSFDWRVRPLVMVVKEWAKRHGINDSACSSFTSYSLVLMVIHYLQCGAQPSVLPNLQQMYPKRFNGRADVRTLNVSLPFEPIPTAMGWQFKEDATLSDLLLGFLRYYAFQFDFDADAISIRMGKKVNRAQVAQNQSPFNTLSQWHCICIEEPFTLSNAAHSVYDERIFQDIKKAFVDSYRELDKQRDLDRFLGTPVEPSTSAQKI
ncbi:hypothetical protein GPALN_014703 [Globodera pallida]|nr:hypothetical protein GPALN_014703 [Globodera pallida]